MSAQKNRNFGFSSNCGQLYYYGTPLLVNNHKTIYCLVTEIWVLEVGTLWCAEHYSKNVIASKANKIKFVINGFERQFDQLYDGRGHFF